MDFWQLSIDWRNNTGVSGNTQISVFQPTGELGYEFVLYDRLRLQFAAALGAEINVATKGDAVGEGAIFLIGLSLMYILE